MARRVAGILLGLLLAVYIGAIAVGATDAGTPEQLGRSQYIGADRYVSSAVTPQGLRSGLRNGDILNTKQLNLDQRLKWWDQAGEAGTVATIPFERNGRTVEIRNRFLAITSEDRLSDWIVFVFICISAACGLALLMLGRDRPSLAAGVMFIGLSLYHGISTFHIWNAPLWLVALFYVFQICSISVFSISAFTLALLLLPSGIHAGVRVALTVVGLVAITATFLVWTLDYSLWIFTAHSIFGGERLFTYTRLAELAAIVLIFGVAAATVRGVASAAVRIVFAATLVGLSAEAASLLYYDVAQQPLPAVYLVLYWLCWSTLFAGYFYALFAKRLVSVDFVINRAVVFASIVALVSGFLVLVEKLIEKFALGAASSFVVVVAATLFIALSLRWVERRIEEVIQRVFYHDKLHAAEALKALTDDFPFVRDTSVLAQHVAQEIRRHLHSKNVAIYLAEENAYQPFAADGHDATQLQAIPDTDPVILRLQSRKTPVDTARFVTAFPNNTVVFPLLVLGRIIGCLCIGERGNGQTFDPDERALIMQVAHEFATALTFLRAGESGAA